MNNIRAKFSISTLSPHCGGVVAAHNPGAALDELSLEEVRPAFQHFGALLFRSFKSDVERFLAFTEKFSNKFSTYEGGAFRTGSMRRHKVHGIDTLLTTTGSNQEFPIPLHGEMYYLGKPPALLWFFCQSSPIQGGETTLADGRKIYAGLRDRIRTFFQENRIKYIRHLTEHQWLQVFGTSNIDDVRKICDQNNCSLFVDSDRSIRTEYVCSALTEYQGVPAFVNSVPALYLNERFREHSKAIMSRDDLDLRVRMADGSPLPDDVISEVLQVAASFTTPVQWQDGDVLMVDNRSHMHGRNSAPPGRRTIFVRLAESSWI